jgi:flagellin
LSVWYDASVAVGSDFGLGLNTSTTSDPAGVTGVASAVVASAASVKAATVYGNVTLKSDKEFSLVPGANAYPTSVSTPVAGNTYTFPAISANNATTDVVQFNYGGKNGTYTVGANAGATATAFATSLNSVAASTIAYVGQAPTLTTTSGAATLTLTSTAGLAVGMSVSGTGIPLDAKILTIDSATGITLSANATAGASVAVTIGGGVGAVQIITPTANSITFTTPKTGNNPVITAPVAGVGLVSTTTQVKAADPTYSAISALGFTPGAVTAKNIGRLDFQVGPAANQLISIQLADFGKGGDITGPITSDKAPTNILSVQSANDVIQNVNKSLDRIAATRANMGAVMNRLEHVIDNLTNVVMNSEASRSQIEDADYAKASTELARTQIMQQAATAVLAQANTSQQTVLKLLQA